MTNFKNSSSFFKMLCHTWCTKLKYAQNLNMIDINIETACKKYLTQYVRIQHRIHVRYL